jgi:hypothetical protein
MGPGIPVSSTLMTSRIFRPLCVATALPGLQLPSHLQVPVPVKKQKCQRRRSHKSSAQRNCALSILKLSNNFLQ